MSMDRLAGTPGAPPQQPIEPQQRVGQPQQVDDVQGASQVAPPPPVVPPPPLQHQDSLQSGNLDVLLDEKAMDAFEMADVQSQYAVPDDDTQHDIEVVLDKGIKKVDDAHKALDSQQEVSLEGVDPLAHDSDHLPDGLEGAFRKMQKLLEEGPRTAGDREVMTNLRAAWVDLCDEANTFLQENPDAQRPEMREKLQQSIDTLNAVLTEICTSDPGFGSMLQEAARLPTPDEMEAIHEKAKKALESLSS